MRARAPKRAEHVRIGPLIGLGFPRPFAVEAFGKIERLVGVGVEYSFLPEVSVASVDTSFRAIALDLRLFPLRGGFFIGARVGHQWLDAKTRVDAGRYGSFRETMAAETWFLNPRIGVLHTFDSGITLGVDAGVQFPIDPAYERRGALADSGLTSGSEIEQALVTAADTLGNRTTATVDLLRIGFLF